MSWKKVNKMKLSNEFITVTFFPKEGEGEDGCWLGQEKEGLCHSAKRAGAAWTKLDMNSFSPLFVIR
jgi:hypothetical protein